MRTHEPAGELLGDALTECAAAGLSGVLRVAGQPGGTIQLAGGRILVIETSGAPSAEVILLRSGRVAESDWEAAFTVAALDGRRMRSELTGRGLVGAGELEAVLRTALADAAFALASGTVDNCSAETGTADWPLPVEPGAGVGWLLAETSRRMQVLASLRGPAVHARDRVAVVPGTVRPGLVLGDGRDEILALADGRRTVRDIAFALGRGVYATILQAARMREEGLLVSVPRVGAGAPGDPAGAGPSAADDGAGRTDDGLPRRHKERPDLPRRRGDSSGWNVPAAIRLLRPRSEGNR